MLFYSNKNVCVGFVGWFLYTLLLLKIIVSMKRCYVGIWKYIEKCVGFVCVLGFVFVVCVRPGFP